MNHIYLEKCCQRHMPKYTCFFDKLHEIEKIAIVCDIKDLKSTSLYKKYRCRFFQLNNIVWPDNIQQIVKECYYPSEYFICVIMASFIIDGYLTNPPISLPRKYISSFSYIPFHYNKLLIIDALMSQGSKPRYYSNDKYIYSEHSGAVSIKNGMVDNIIISAETDRVDLFDDNIFLPNNTDILNEYPYIFHTHPNTMQYGGRIKDGILYEFPSANDIFNYVKYHNEGRAQGSLIIAPEGSYLIRPVAYQKEIKLEDKMYNSLNKIVLQLEKDAILKYQNILKTLTNPDIFHQKISSDVSFIKKYNRYLNKFNLFIEYFPRTKVNNEWRLQQINLPNIDFN